MASQTLADLFVSIGADTTGFDREMRQMQREMATATTDMRRYAGGFTSSFGSIGPKTQELKARMMEWHATSKTAMSGFKEDMAGVQLKFLDMAQGMKDFKGSNDEFLHGLEKLGKEQKTITDNMMKQNEAMKLGFIQGIATMLARSTQSEKIAQNFDRMNNPLYKVNNSFLAITGNLERMAHQGQPAVLALKMLGPTANMKALNDMTMLINGGLMRMPMVAMAGGLAVGLMFAGLAKSASENVPGFKGSLQEMGASISLAFRPMVEIFGQVVMAIANLITKVAVMVSNFNSAHPILAKVLQGFLMLIPILILILSPLAIGIGLVNGLTASFGALWMMIGPGVIGLGAIMGTVLLVAGALVALGVAVWALWTKTDWFKGAVIGAWEAIKTATIAVWNYIYNNGIKPAIDAISTYVTSVLTRLKAFWQLYGDDIMKILSIAWTLIKTIFMVNLEYIKTIFLVAFTLLKTTVSVVFQAIKTIIDVVLNTIGGLIKFWVAIFHGDFKGALNAIKGIFEDNFNTIVNFIKGLGSTFFDAGKGLVEMMAKGIKSAMGSVLDGMKELAKKARDFLPFSPAKTGPLSDLDKLDFGGPISDSINKAIPNVKGLLTDLVTLPAITTAHGQSASTGSENHVWNVSINADSLEQVKSITDLFNTLQQTKRARG
jgi:hypothetical protein